MTYGPNSKASSETATSLSWSSLLQSKRYFFILPSHLQSLHFKWYSHARTMAVQQLYKKPATSQQYHTLWIPTRTQPTHDHFFRPDILVVCVLCETCVHSEQTYNTKSFLKVAMALLNLRKKANTTFLTRSANFLIYGRCSSTIDCTVLVRNSSATGTLRLLVLNICRFLRSRSENPSVMWVTSDSTQRV